MSDILTRDEYRREMDECTDTCIHEGGFDMKLLAHDAALRLALDTATREMDRAIEVALSSERAYARLRKECDKEIRALECERDALLSKAPPPADAATEAVRESAAILRRRLDTGRECRDCGEVLGLKGMVDDFLDLIAALSTPAPAPSAKETRT